MPGGRPHHLGPEYSTRFKDPSIVEAYHLRLPYPAEIFEILTGLISDEPRSVLDAGSGTGNKELELRGLFQQQGEKQTAPVSFVQSIDDYVEAFHSMSSLSRHRITGEMAAA